MLIERLAAEGLFRKEVAGDLGGLNISAPTKCDEEPLVPANPVAPPPCPKGEMDGRVGRGGRLILGGGSDGGPAR